MQGKVERQITDHLVMVRPASFGYNAETAATNTFQHEPTQETGIAQKAQAEFDHLVALLRREGVTVTVWNDSPEPVKPDAVFPNNWISFHADGSVVTYPMYSSLRRLERQDVFIHDIAADYVVKQRIALEELETKDRYLEGTGSLVLDRVNRIAYACISPRTDERALQQWSERMGYAPFTFHAQYAGSAIYHTNVMMAIGEGIAVVGLDVVKEEKRDALYQSLQSGGRSVVTLTEEQIGLFAGNMLAVLNQLGEQLMVMSTTALNSLHEQQVNTIKQFARIVACDVSTIESIGGGSVRCMLAENFLPLR